MIFNPEDDQIILNCTALIKANCINGAILQEENSARFKARNI